MNACSAWCGWCGACTSAGDSPRSRLRTTDAVIAYCRRNGLEVPADVRALHEQQQAKHQQPTLAGDVPDLPVKVGR